MEEANRLIKACLEKEEPFCAPACPFHYDIREFTSRLKRGSFSGAYRTFANAVGFPAVVAALCGAPCKSVCPRESTDAAIDLPRLEAAAINYTADTKPNSYNMPPKEQKIAIVGAGLSGLGCALRLCNRKYQVTIFEQSGRIGGQLWEKLKPEIFLAEIEKQFMYEQYKLCLNTKITDPAILLNDFNAVYIATGKGGGSFGLLKDIDMTTINPPCASGVNGVFLGGALTGAADMEALAQGLQAAGLIEAWLKTGNMKGAEPHPPTRMKLDPGALTYQKAVIAGDNGFTKEQAIDEAKRCLGCRCDACFRHCPMMSYFEKFPSRIADEVAVTVNPGTLDGNGTVATRLISTCSQCGLCAEVCPQEINVGDFLRLSHQTMRSRGAMPWAFHDFWLRDMAHARGESAAFCGSSIEKNEEKPRYLFFPGCQLGASEPQYVLGAYSLLKKAAPDTAIQLGCCGAPAIWAGDVPLQGDAAADIRGVWNKFGQPLMILACPSCAEVFRQYLPEINTVFILDILAELGIKPRRTAAGEEIAVFDPCSMRRHEQSRQNVRNMAQDAGYTVRELPYHGEKAQCCSFGGQMDIANPPFKRRLVKQHSETSSLPYLVYCSNCRDVFSGGGKQVIHALELFEGCERATQETPGIEQRILNRRIVKEEIVKRYFPERSSELTPPPALPPLNFSPGLAEKLDGERIFRADVAAVITDCEASRRRLRTSTGRFVGHSVIGHMTYWVEYKPENGGYTVHNAYAHRMKIEGEQPQNG